MRRALLETLKFLYGLAVSGVLFLFFCLLLDLFCLWVGGGWDPMLGTWPIFTGTVGIVFYGPSSSSIGLVLGLGIVARLVMWNKVPALLEGLAQQEG